MKAKLLLIISLFTFIFSLAAGQVPQGFNYQAIARDGSGNVIPNQSFPVKIDLQTSLSGGTLIYEETFSSITSNNFGLITLVVGTGTQTGGSAASFSAIDWKAQPIYMKTTVEHPVGTPIVMGTSQVWAVPYSLVAKDLQGPVSSLGIAGTSTYTTDSTLFEVRNKDGNIVFAVYNEGVRVYVGEGSKGAKSGFAVGGFGTDKGTSQKYLVISKDSARIYVDSNPATKGLKSGFAVGGYDMTKGATQDYFDVSGDSIRAYIAPGSGKGAKGGFAVGGFDASKTALGEEYLRITRDSSRINVLNSSTKGAKGGFAVGGFDATKGGAVTAFTSLTPNNYLIGEKSGGQITTGLYNSFIGYETGVINSIGNQNVFLGYQAGYNNNADNNVFLGFQSGYSNSGGISNTFLGHLAGYNNLSGNSNVFLGDSAGYGNLAGIQNIFLGNGSGKSNNGNYNAFIGYEAGYTNGTGANNSFIGYQAGRSNSAGKNNIFIGYKSGYSNIGDGSAFTGNSNVYIGDQSGLGNSTGYSNVYIGQQAGIGLSTGINVVYPPVNNVYIGYQSGYSEYTGTFNTFIGYQTGFTNNSGNWNTFIGFQSGYKNTAGNANMFIGYQAGFSNTTGLYNVFNGYHAGRGNTTGYQNTYIGFKCGYTNQTGNYNVAIGDYAGYWETDSRRLYISVNKATSISSGIDSSLIYGQFDTQIIRLNRFVGIGLTPTTSSQALEVSGGARVTNLAGTGNRALYVDPTGILTLSTSDERLKDNIIPIDNALGKVLGLQGVTYSWKNDPQKQRFIGFVAQDVEKVIPELVFTDNASGMKGVDYAEMSAVLAESIKSQQKIIDDQQKQIMDLKSLNEENSKRLELLEQAFADLKSASSAETAQK